MAFDLMLMFLLVLGPSWAEHGHLHISWSLLLFFIIWPIVSYALGKYKSNMQSIKNEFIAIITSAFVFWGVISLYVITFQYYERSYSDLIMGIGYVLLIELVFRTIYYAVNRKKYLHHKISFLSSLSLRKKRWIIMLFNLICVFASFMIMVWIKPATVRVYLPNYTSFLILYLIWELLVNLISKKNDLSTKNRFRDFIKPVVLTNTFTFLVLGFIVFGFQLFSLSRLVIFGSVALASALQLFIVSYYYMHLKLDRNVDESERLLKVTPFEEKPGREDDHKLRAFKDLQDETLSVDSIINKRLLADKPELVEFLRETVNLKGIQSNKSLALDTQTVFNLKTQEKESLDLFINLHKVNDLGNINNYYKMINDRLELGGITVGCGRTIAHIYNKYVKSYPPLLGHMVYGLNFIFKRVFPKLPGFKELNYLLTRGRNRTLSETEILGRLVYSGFKILATREIDGRCYFIAAKVNDPYDDINPSYGPIISLKRVGKNGEIFRMYKLRTMHPYSEYLQAYAYERNELAEGGKIKNDFRVTGWGRICRKLWLDEFPQFINIFKGQVRIVGVRALSQHYYGLYPKELQELRIKTKPGLLPPFYLDMPKTMEEIIDSEMRYLNAYLEKPVQTQIKYFFTIWYNILIKGKRSA